MIAHRMRPTVRRLALVPLVVALLAASTPAAATPQTILRGTGNVLLAPLDAALAPISTFVGIKNNLRDIDDPLPVKIIYPVPGYFYAVGLQFMCSWIRLTTGFLEMGAGVLVLPLDTDIEPLFDPVDDAEALVEIDIDYMDYPLRFGVNYTISAF